VNTVAAAVELPRIMKVGEPAEPSFEFGVVAHLNNQWELYLAPGDIDEALNLITDAGIEAIRLDFPWSDIEPQDDDYYWAHFDPIVDAIEERGLKIIAIAGYSPPCRPRRTTPRRMPGSTRR